VIQAVTPTIWRCFAPNPENKRKAVAYQAFLTKNNYQSEN
jgi:hypothetical protein